jgi:RIO-like serine/threonine protein kinase
MYTLTFCTLLFNILAVKEFAFMKALHAHGFPTPTPIDQSRHIVAMSKIEGEEQQDQLILVHLFLSPALSYSILYQDLRLYLYQLF